MTASASDSVDELRLTRGSGNVFADLGFPEPRTHQLKAKLVTHIRGMVETGGDAEVAAGAIIGLSQDDLQRVFRGHFHDVSMEQLIALAEGLGYGVDLVITVGANPRRRE